MIGVGSQKESTRKREAYFMEYAERVRAELPDLPLMLTGGFRSVGAMEDAIASGAVDLVGLGRPLTVDPETPAQLLDGSIDHTVVHARRTGVRLVDSLTGLVHWTVQMWRMADGRDPAPNQHPFFTTGRYMLRTGIDGVRVRPRKK
jgi:hypothetical protein